MTLQYIGPRIVPGLFELHNISRAYEALDVVDDGMGTSYIAKIPVPVNIPLSNTTYWAVWGSTSGAIIDLQNQVSEIKSHIVTPEYYGAAGDGITDDTAAINDMLANLNGGIALFTKNYLIDGAVTATHEDGGLQVKSNSTLIFTDGSTLIEKSNDAAMSHPLLLLDVENVTIEGVTVIGDYDTHTLSPGGTTDEWCHGIHVISSKNITIRNATIKDCYGDGIYIGQAWAAEVLNLPSDNHCRNVTVENVIIDKAGRNGLTLGDCDGWSISNLNISNVTRTNPKAAIDIEQEGDYSPYVSDGTLSEVNSTGCTVGVKVTQLTGARINLDGITGNDTELVGNSSIINLHNAHGLVHVGGSIVKISDSDITYKATYGNGLSWITNSNVVFDGDCEVPLKLIGCLITGASTFKKYTYMHSCILRAAAGDTYYVKMKAALYIKDCEFEDIPATIEHLVVDDTNSRYYQLDMIGCTSSSTVSSIATAMVSTNYAKMINGNNYFPFSTDASTAPVTGCVNINYNSYM